LAPARAYLMAIMNRQNISECDNLAIQLGFSRFPMLIVAAGDIPTCRKVVEHARLIRAVDLSFPIILSADGGVMDGMHRVCRALMDEQKTIRTVRFAKDPEPDYIGVDSR